VPGEERWAGRRSVRRLARCAAESCTQVRILCLSRCLRGLGLCHAHLLCGNFEGGIPCGGRELIRYWLVTTLFIGRQGLRLGRCDGPFRRSYVTQTVKSVRGPACKWQMGRGYRAQDFVRCGVRASAGGPGGAQDRLLPARRRKRALIGEAYRSLTYRSEAYRSEAQPRVGCDLRAPSVPAALASCPQSTGRGARQFHAADSQHDSAGIAHSFRATGQKRRASNPKAVECVVLPCFGPPNRGPCISYEPLTL
jgi:hypothetical protein